MSIDSFNNYLREEIFYEFGDRFRSRKMFGGVGYYLDDRIFGLLVSDGDVYFKVGENNKAEYEKYHSKPFIYEGHSSKGPTSMPYWRVPDEVLEDHQTVLSWAEKAAENSKAK